MAEPAWKRQQLSAKEGRKVGMAARVKAANTPTAKAKAVAKKVTGKG